MSTRVAALLARRLYAWGVRRVFVASGETVFGPGDAMPEGLDLVAAPGEEFASSMALAQAWIGSVAGVCIAGTPAGAVRLLSALGEARQRHLPMLAVVALEAAGAPHVEAALQVLAGDWLHRVSLPGDLQNAVDAAMRGALRRPGVACLLVPPGLLDLPAESPVHAEAPAAAAAWHALPADAELAAAARVLNAGERVAIVAGAGAARSGDDLVRLAGALGAGLAMTPAGKGVVPDDLPFVTGTFGPWGTQPSWAMLKDCDTLVLVGVDALPVAFMPPARQARAVQIDIDPARLGRALAVEAGLAGDCGAVLRALLPHLRPRRAGPWRARVERLAGQWRRWLDAGAGVPFAPLSLHEVFRELSRRLPPGCLVTADPGRSAFWLGLGLRLRSGMAAWVPGPSGGGVSALAGALAAKMACPGRPVIALAGEQGLDAGGFQLLAAAAEASPRWPDPRLLVVTWRRRRPEGGASGLPAADFARLLGMPAVRLEKPGSAATAWDAALAAERPVLVDVDAGSDAGEAALQLETVQRQAHAAALASGAGDARAAAQDPGRHWWGGSYPADGREAGDDATRPAAEGATWVRESSAGEEDPGAALDSLRHPSGSSGAT